MSGYRTVIVGTDGSDSSLRAVERAARLAAHANARLIVASALSYYDSYRTATLPDGLLQAQRDFFGAHLYERVDQPRGEMFHIDWPDPARPQLKASELGMSR